MSFVARKLARSRFVLRLSLAKRVKVLAELSRHQKTPLKFRSVARCCVVITELYCSQPPGGRNTSSVSLLVSVSLS